MPRIPRCFSAPGAMSLPVLLFMAALLAPAGALAHRVNIFAWPEGDKILVECGFNRSSPVRDGLVTVYDAADGAELLRGRTDAQGRFAFPVPDAMRRGHGLRIEVNAGEGHVNVWTMEASEIAGAEALSAGPGEASGQADAPAAAPAPASSATAGTGAAPAPPGAPRWARDLPVTAPEVRAIVTEALNTGLAPLRRELAALSAPGPTLRDIIGGLGWLMGLAGIACYALARRREGRR